MRPIHPALAFAVVLGLLTPRAALAVSTGRSGATGKQGADQICNMCHSGGVAPTVVLTGPNTLTPGQVAQYKLTITPPAGEMNRATGMGVAATDGITLTPGPNQKLLNGEIVHNAPLDVPANASNEYTFTLTAPAAPGAITLWAAGNNANKNGNNQGDLAATTSLPITVIPASSSTSDAGVAPPAAASADAAAAPPGQNLATSPTVAASGGDGGTSPFYLRNADEETEPHFADTGLSCSVSRGSGGASGFGFGMALVGLLLRRGRRR